MEDFKRNGRESVGLKPPAPTVPPWLKPENEKTHLAKVAEQFKKLHDEQADEDSSTTNALSYILKQIEDHQKETPNEPKTKNPTVETFTGEFHLDPFTGSPLISFENWQTQFEYSLAFLQIPPSTQQKLARLLANLKGAARLAYEEYADDVKADYNLLTAALRASFTNAVAKRTANSALSCCRQKADESVHDFSTRLTELVRTAMDGEQPATIKAVLTFQLKEKLRDDIKAKINVHECNTYDDVLKKALDRENYVQQKLHFAEKSAIDSNYAEKQKPVSDSNYVEKQKLQCFLCKKEGHFARECEYNSIHRQRAPQFHRRSLRNNNYRNRHQDDYQYHPNGYRSQSPANSNYRNDRRNDRQFYQESSKHRSKSPSNNSYRNNYQSDRSNYYQKSASYRSKSPSFNSYRNPRERYHSGSEGEHRSGRNSSVESRKSPGPSRRRIRFADTNVTEGEQSSEAEFFSFEPQFTKHFHQKYVHDPDSTVSGDASSEEENEKDLVAFSKYFQTDDDEYEYLQDSVEAIPREELFSDDSELIFEHHDQDYKYTVSENDQQPKVTFYDPSYPDEDYEDTVLNQQPKVTFYNQSYLDKLISARKLKNKNRRLRWKAKKQREKYTVIQNPVIRKPDKDLNMKKLESMKHQKVTVTQNFNSDTRMKKLEENIHRSTLTKEPHKPPQMKLVEQKPLQKDTVIQKPISKKPDKKQTTKKVQENPRQKDTVIKNPVIKKTEKLPKPEKRKQKSRQKDASPVSDDSDSDFGGGWPGYKPKLRSVIGKWIMISMIILTLLGNVCADPIKPLLCHPRASKTLFKLPENSICHNVNWMPDETPNFAPFTIFRPNTIAYRTPATYCLCQNSTGTHTRTVSNDDVYSPVTHQGLPVSATECLKMKNSKNSKFGKLQEVLKSFATNNSLEFPDRSWPFSLQTDTDSAQNCYVHTTEVVGHHDDEYIFKQFHNEIYCKYTSGVCNMEDSGTLIWEPELEANSEFIYWDTLDGDLSSNIWISRDRELALTFKNKKKIEDGNNTFLVSDQGYAVLLHQYEDAQRPKNATRIKRESVGIVTTNQFSAQLTATQENSLSVTKDYFKSALYHICQTSDTLADAIISLAESNPTLLARKLLNVHNIQARLVSDSLIEITVCEELNLTQVSFTHQNNCFDAMPVVFHYGSDVLHGFMDMVTGVIVNTANEVDCNKIPYFYIEQPDYKVKQFDQRTGHVEYVKEATQLNFKSPKLQFIQHDHMSFKNLVITNLTEIFNYQIFYDATKQAETFSNLANHVDKVKAEPQMNAYYEKIVDHASNLHGFFNFSFSNISWYNFWVFISCLTVNTAVFIFLILLFIAYWFNIFGKIRKIPGFRSRTTRETLFPKDYRTPEEILQMITVQKTPQKKHRQRPKSEIYANETPFRAVGYTTAKLLQKDVKSLIDTGSGISVITTSCLKKMKGKLEFKPMEVDLVGLSSTSVTTLGVIKAEIEICGWKDTTKFAVIDSSTRNFAYDILIGGNTLKQMPEIAFNFQKNYLRIDNVKQPIGFENMNQKIELFTAEPEIIIQRPNVTPEQQIKINDLLNEFSDRFSTSEFDIDQDCELVAPPLKVLPGTKPIAAKPFKVAEKLKPVILAFITALLAASIIVEANTPWLSNVFPVKKSNGKYRTVVDLRPLNNVCEKDYYPLPNMESLLQTVAGCYYYTVCDLSAAFYQLNVDEKSSHFFGIICEFGIFKFVKLPMGAKNSPSAFQRAMKSTLKNCECFAIAYLDDILIFTRINSFSEHLNHIRQVLMALRESKLKIRAEKTRIAQRNITFLGHEISKDGVKPSKKHIEALQKREPPKNKKECHNFLGMVNFFHRYVERFSEIAAPLTKLLKKNAEFVWTDEQQNAFTTLIKALTTPPILRAPNFQQDFFVFADASLIGIGGAVMQKYGNDYFPISYCSRCLTPCERNYSATEIELLGIVFTLRRHHSILYGHTVHLKTDHRPLTHLETKLSTSTRLNRWLVDLMEYDIADFRHIPGKLNVIADGLSRQKTTIEANTTESGDNYKRLREATATELQKVIEYVNNNWLNYTDEASVRPYFLVRNDLEFKHHVLYKSKKVVVPPSMQPEILKFLHRSHFGLEKTKMHARSHFWFPKMNQSITVAVQTCESCNENAKINPKKFHSSWPAAEKNWSRVHADFAGPIFGSMWLIMIDSRSKYPFVIKMKKTTAAATITAFESIFSIISYPDFLITDNGPQFISAELRTYCNSHNIQHKFSPPYHPCSNGIAEKFVGTFKASIKKMLQENPKLNVNIAVHHFLEDYRNIPHTTTGVAPSIMLFNRYSTNSVDAYRPKYKAESRPTKYEANDTVYRRCFNEKKRKWMASTIDSVQGNYIYVCQDPDGRTIRVHENDLKPRINKP